VIVPAYDAAPFLEGVLDEIALAMPEIAGEGGKRDGILVIDDGSRDATARIAARGGALVISHGKNRGKGAALMTGLATARSLGYDVALAVDADGQHPGDAARDVLYGAPDPEAFVLGVRDLVRDGAPKPNQFSNGVSNFFLSYFARNWWGFDRALADTQCGLRRYPVRTSLALAAESDGYAFEAEILLRAIAAHVDVVEVPVAVRYPATRVTHFHSVKDPARIVAAVVRTLRELGRG
jgi:glycosyltransferase involved in cell wall biosynthesis